MGRIGDRLAYAKSRGRPALITYVTAGFPDRGHTASIIEAMVEGGADVVEIGVPFDRPFADGPTIRRASRHALAGGTTPEGCLRIASKVRGALPDVPSVLMTYADALNEVGGPSAYAVAASKSSVDGLIVIGETGEEAGETGASCKAHGVDYIPVVAPDWEESEIAASTRLASGFVYCRSRAGLTGARKRLPEGLSSFLGRVRRHTALPLAVGFGVSRPEHVRSLCGLADAVVVGSAIIDIIASSPSGEMEARVRDYIRSLLQFQ